MSGLFTKMLSFYCMQSKEDIIGSANVRKHFEILCAQNIPCTLVVEGKYTGDIPAEFQSCFIRAEREYVIIDNLIPEHGNDLIEKNDNWKLQYSMHEIKYSITTPLTKFKNNSTIIVGIPFPEMVSGNRFNS